MNRPMPPGGRLAGWPASLAVAALAAGIFLTWAPHYLTWPWWPDLDAFAAIAQGWDRGILPYRDVVVLNFPGQIEVFWILGKLFGWGRTTPIYALDAALVAALGVVAALWSRRVFGRALPGLVGFVAALTHYASQDFRHVAQRDWQGPELAAIALMILQGWPGRGGRVASAVVYAVAATVRPHVILFLPVLVVIIGETGWRGRLRDLGEWSVLFVAALIVCLSPLIFQGIVGDFVRGIRIAGYDRGYSQASPRGFVVAVIREVAIKRIGAALILNLAALAIAPNPLRRRILPWVIAFGIALIYAPLHPRPHLYLDHPMWLFWSISLAVLVAVGLAVSRTSQWGQLGSILIALALGIPGVPRFCDMQVAMVAPRILFLSQDPRKVPPGARDFFRPTAPQAPYGWEDYLRTLEFLRKSENRGRMVAGFFRNPPFPAVNGPTGHVTLWPAESGTIWLWAVDPRLEPNFVAALERSRASLLVWCPGEAVDDPRCELPGLERAARRLFHFGARFGEIEIWERNLD